VDSPRRNSGARVAAQPAGAAAGGGRLPGPGSPLVEAVGGSCRGHAFLAVGRPGEFLFVRSRWRGYAASGWPSLHPLRGWPSFCPALTRPDGRIGGTAVAGLSAVLLSRWNSPSPGGPWRRRRAASLVNDGNGCGRAICVDSSLSGFFVLLMMVHRPGLSVPVCCVAARAFGLDSRRTMLGRLALGWMLVAAIAGAALLTPFTDSVTMLALGGARHRDVLDRCGLAGHGRALAAGTS